jgi:RNA-binding protein
MEQKNRVGITLHISCSSNNLILKAESNVTIGDPVINGKGDNVGIVFDIFGPTKNPYISIKTRIEDPKRLIGKPLYLGKYYR